MESRSSDPAEGPSDAEDESQKLSLASGRRTSHTGKQSGLGYGMGVVLHQLRPFIPFVIISILVVVLVYLLQTIIYGGPFTDPHFFAKFNERWPRPDPRQVSASAVPPVEPFSPAAPVKVENYTLTGLRVNGTRG